VERLFQKSIKRRTVSLNGQWQIAYDPEGKGERLGYIKGEFSGANPIYVPGCWNFELGKYDYFGAVWYSRKFNTAQTCNSRIIFHAVSGQAEVYLNGKKLGSHYGSYTKFWFDVPMLSAGEHTLVVKVDNSINDEDTLPLRFVDWFVWGGVYRGVEIESFDNLSIEGMWVETNWKGYSVDGVIVKTNVKNWSGEHVTDTFKLEIGGEVLSTKTEKIRAGETTEMQFALEDFSPQLWNPENPQLYMVHLCCGDDDLYERTGFRKIEVQGTRILLNGKEIFIKGINRHNDNPELGYAITPSLILKDMQIIKNLGANAIRGSHYPNDPVVLDYCDQFGLLFWEEIPFWNHPAESLTSPLLEKRSRYMMKEMITRDYNHPSIIIWGIQNESKSSSKEGLNLFSKLADDIRSLDKSRLVSFASACGREDICFDLVDIVCWNQYPGWYEDDKSIDDLDKRYTESLRNNRQWLKENGQNKPFIISEFGAGAILGDTAFDHGMRWTENYQEQLLEKAVRAIVDSGVMQGFYIWQFCDGRTAIPRKTSIGRPRNFNNKGLVDEHRKPKRAYYTVKNLFKKIPTYTGYTAESENGKTQVKLRQHEVL
jgi:beta-glucuronidase